MDKSAETTPLIAQPASSQAKVLRRWRNSWIAVFGDGSPSDVAACCLTWHAPCVSFGWNSSRGLNKSFWGEAVRFLAILTASLIVVHMATCGVMWMVCHPMHDDHHMMPAHGHWEDATTTATFNTWEGRTARGTTADAHTTTTATFNTWEGSTTADAHRDLMAFNTDAKVSDSAGTTTERSDTVFTEADHDDGNTRKSRSNSHWGHEGKTRDSHDSRDTHSRAHWDHEGKTRESRPHWDNDHASYKPHNAEWKHDSATKETPKKQDASTQETASMLSSIEGGMVGQTTATVSTKEGYRKTVGEDSHTWGPWDHHSYSHWDHPHPLRLSPSEHHACMVKAAPLTAAGLAVALAIFAYFIYFAARRRQALRERFGIEGSMKQDCALWTFCSFCALAQETRTLMHENVHDGMWHGPHPAPVMGAPAQQAFMV